MSDAVDTQQRVLIAEGYSRRLQDCTSIEEYSPIVQELLLAGPPGLLLTLVATDSGSVKRLSQLIADTRHRLEEWPGQPVKPPRHAPRPYPRRVR